VACLLTFRRVFDRVNILWKVYCHDH